jgi:hypothetical protein
LGERIMDESELTPDEMEALEELGYGYPKPEEKQNIFSFFKRILIMKDTTRVANLTSDELGLVKVPTRTNLNISLYAKAMGLSGLAEYFKQEALVSSDTSLGKEGFLDKLAVTQKREMESKTRAPPSESQKRSWFKRKEPTQEYSS